MAFMNLDSSLRTGTLAIKINDKDIRVLKYGFILAILIDLNAGNLDSTRLVILR